MDWVLPTSWIPHSPFKGKDKQWSKHFAPQNTLLLGRLASKNIFPQHILLPVILCPSTQFAPFNSLEHFASQHTMTKVYEFLPGQFCVLQ